MHLKSNSTQKQRSSNLFAGIDISRKCIKNESPIEIETDLGGVTSADIYNSLSNASSASPVAPENNLISHNEANILTDLMTVPVVSKDDVFVE
eukprot:UN11893